MIEVRVNAQVAFSRIDGGGTRRVRCADGTVHVFSNVPQLFAELPPEIAADPYLLKRTVAEAAPVVASGVAPVAEPAATAPTPEGEKPENGAPTDNKKGDRVQIAAVPSGLPIADVDLSSFDYAALVKLAKDMGVPFHGKKKDDLREELRGHIVANDHADPAAGATEPPATED